jgi:hypothetical protein
MDSGITVQAPIKPKVVLSLCPLCLGGDCSYGDSSELRRFRLTAGHSAHDRILRDILSTELGDVLTIP